MQSWSALLLKPDLSCPLPEADLQTHSCSHPGSWPIRLDVRRARRDLCATFMRFLQSALTSKCLTERSGVAEPVVSCRLGAASECISIALHRAFLVCLSVQCSIEI